MSTRPSRSRHQGLPVALLAPVLVGALLGLPGLASAAPGTPTTPAGSGTLRSTAPTPPVGRVTFIDSPSSEKPAARAQRLKRECKGRPNAGACLGYTR